MFPFLFLGHSGGEKKLKGTAGTVSICIGVAALVTTLISLGCVALGELLDMIAGRP